MRRYGRQSSAGWVMIQSSAWEVGYWSGGAPVGNKSPSSGRSLIPARKPGRVGSRRDPSDGRVNLVVHFSILMPRRGAGAFIVSAVDHSYLLTLLLLWPTMPSYPSTTLVVPVVRRAFAVNSTEQEPGNFDVTRVDPTEQELGNCNVARVGPTEQELGNCNVARVDPTEQELGNCDVARVDPTEQELGNCDVRLLPRVSPGANPGIWPRG
ncbi:hypothetical protein BHE74_00058146 [Ensete ventricosum]|nr:hypothetical protein BHE74_00058146 [Ensete ventricosum]